MLYATIVGNIGGSPELKYSKDGNPFLKFSVASNDRDADGNDTTEWVSVTVFRQRAETLSNYLSKGMKVTVIGPLKARPWITQNTDELRAGLEMIGERVEFMSPREDGGGQQERRGSSNAGGNRQQGNGGGGGYTRGAGGNRQAAGSTRQAGTATAARPAPQQRSMEDADDGDDLPF